jgi:large subunit ribosomal protein L29
MKAAQHMSDLRALDQIELDARLKAVRTELFNLRFQAATGQLENHRQIRQVRRQIAQVLTVLQGRSLGFEQIARPEPAAEAGAPAPRARQGRKAAAENAAATDPVAETADEPAGAVGEEDA